MCFAIPLKIYARIINVFSISTVQQHSLLYSTCVMFHRTFVFSTKGGNLHMLTYAYYIKLLRRNIIQRVAR